jgi:hypothetical protein
VQVLEEGEALLKGGEVGREVEGGGQVVVKTWFEPREEGRGPGGGRGTVVLRSRKSTGGQGTFKGGGACAGLVMGVGEALFVLEVEGGDEGGIEEPLLDFGEEGGLLPRVLPGVTIEKEGGEIKG